MASFANIQYRGYNGGWHNWSANNANLYGAYAGTDISKHCVVIALQTSSGYSGTSSSVTLTIPFVRQAKSAKSGTFYVKWHGTTDPTGGNKPQPCGSATVTKAWESSDQQVHQVSVTINTADITKESTWYYISIGSSNTIQVGYKGYDSYWGSSFTYWTAGTAPSCDINQTGGNNTITFSGKLGKSGDSNAMSSATLYYWMNGATSYATQALTAISESDWKVTKTANQDDRVWAYVKCAYPHGDKSCSEVWRDCYYYTAGGTPTCFISQSTGSNTVAIYGSRGDDGSHNGKTASKLYYNLGKGESDVEVNLGTTGSNSYTHILTMDSSNNNKTISAYVTTTYTYGGSKTGYATDITSKYYSPVATGSVAFTDNGDNSFSITGTRGTDGSNNKVIAATLYWTTTKNAAGEWTYTEEDNTQAFGTTGSDSSLVVDSTSTKYDIDIPTNSNQDQVIVAGAVVTSGEYTVNNIQSTDTGWITAGISLYKSPKSAPSDIALDYDKNRLTVKEDWTLSWKAPEPGNNNSPICGYRIRIWVDGTTIPIKDTSGTVLSVESGTEANRHYYDTESTDTSFVISPIQHNFQPGNDIAFTIHAYSKNGKGEKMFSAVGSTGSWPVENAGIVRIKAGGTWKEGQVWIKTGGVWKEATSVQAKVAGVWKEST